MIAPTPVRHYCYANELLSVSHSFPGTQPDSTEHGHCSTYHHFLCIPQGYLTTFSGMGNVEELF